jgi:hypothetical protein
MANAASCALCRPGDMWHVYPAERSAICTGRAAMSCTVTTSGAGVLRIWVPIGFPVTEGRVPTPTVPWTRRPSSGTSRRFRAGRDEELTGLHTGPARGGLLTTSIIRQRFGLPHGLRPARTRRCRRQGVERRHTRIGLIVLGCVEARSSSDLADVAPSWWFASVRALPWWTPPSPPTKGSTTTAGPTRQCAAGWRLQRCCCPGPFARWGA